MSNGNTKQSTESTLLYVFKRLEWRPAYRIGLPKLFPPTAERGWQLCSVTYSATEIIVGWRRRMTFNRVALLGKSEAEAPAPAKEPGS